MSTTSDELREEVRRRYAESALAVSTGSGSCGCGSGSCCEGDETMFGETLYDAEQRAELPEAAALASLGCGNPTAVAELREGETVLDLGSGGGIDVILSAKRVGPTGTVYGLDMTDEMLALARRNAREAGVTNVHFLKGVIEQIPLPAESVDVVISNCVINLSTDKPAVLTEIARVLRPGGRLGISDVVAEDRLSPEERAERGSFVGCIAGALSVGEYVAGLEAAGFDEDLRRPHARCGRRDARRDREGGEDGWAGAAGHAGDPAGGVGRLLLTGVLTRALAAELIGTFALVFVAAGAVMVDAEADTLGQPGIAVASGLVIMAMVYAVGHVSGAHLNPAVSLAFALTRHFPATRVAAYWAAQAAGAVLAALALRGSLGDVANIGATLPSVSYGRAFLWEVVLTFLLLFVVMAVATDTRAVGEAAAIAIGGTVALAVMVGGPVSGASLNPARSLGPAVVSGEWRVLWLYLLAPALGATAGALAYQLVRGDRPPPQPGTEPA